MNLSFKGKTVVVSGAALGFGRAIAESFASLGASVHGCDILEKELAEEDRDFLHVIDRSTARLLSVVEDLLLVAQMQTGEVRLARYCAVDDVGTMLNPLLCEGQIHGGIVQGVGQALLENLVYDPESGQLVTGSFQDYGMPRADDFCRFELEENSSPTDKNPLGVKGVGEAGTLGAIPAVMNAVNNALAAIGAAPVELPATAEKLWRAIRAAS